MDGTNVCIKRFADIPVDRLGSVHEGIDEIFFGASFQTTFSDQSERDRFRALWVGQYLDTFPELCLVALRGEAVVGYLAGYIPLANRARTFPDQHHMPVFADLHAAFPAHLHINIHPEARSVGIGARLIERFVATCRVHNCRGVHIVTSNGGRNNAFYRRVGFTHEVRRATETRDMIFMGREL